MRRYTFQYLVVRDVRTVLLSTGIYFLSAVGLIRTFLVDSLTFFYQDKSLRLFPSLCTTNAINRSNKQRSESHSALDKRRMNTIEAGKCLSYFLILSAYSLVERSTVAIAIHLTANRRFTRLFSVLCA